MKTRSLIEAQLAQMARLEAGLLEQLATVDAYGEDVWEVGTVIVFHKQFTAGGTEYTYAAIKAEIAAGVSGWYVTGKEAHRAKTWDQLISLFTTQGPAPEVLVCTELTPLAETQP